jgi:tRNA threonylcarbamoyladenosine biosynthesis protein TsaE
MSQISFVVDLSDAEATRQLGCRLGEGCPPGTVLLLSGDLGSGKTTLVQGLGVGLGVKEPISSPTFTLINEYFEGRIPLYHVDLYRLNPEQVGSLELNGYWDGTEAILGILAIEWSERMMDCPEAAISLELETIFAGGRRAILAADGDAQIAVLKKVMGDGLLVDEV